MQRSLIIIKMCVNDNIDFDGNESLPQKDKKLFEVACMSLQQLERMISTAKHQKLNSLYKRVQIAQLDVDSENQQYARWQQIYSAKVQNNQPNPFRNSVQEMFRRKLFSIKVQLWLILAIELIGYTVYSATPFLLLKLYENVTAQRLHSNQNKMLILIIVVSRVFRILFSFYAEMKLKELGLRMYRLTVYAIIKKTFRCSPLSNQNLSVSQMVKMMHNDCFMVMSYPTKLALVLDYSANLFISTAIIIHVSGISGLLGLLFLFSTLLIRFLVKQKVDAIGEQLEKLSSARIKATIQTIGIIKYIKTNALQSCYYNKLRNLRVEEVKQLKKKLFIEMVQNAANFLKFLSVVLIIKLLVNSNSLISIETVFTICLCIGFSNTQAIINAIAYLEMISASISNIQKFMQQQDINWSHLNTVNDHTSLYSVEIEDGTFSWKNIQESVTQDSGCHHLRNINIKIEKGELIGIVGSYGSGKSSFVNSIIGQMNKKGNPSVTVNGKIAYASQNPWVMNQTVRNNILFGNQYNQKRYVQAIKYACLESDLKMFPHGDLTIIGKKGSTLSGGQRARVSFARALYSNADIFILDDLLSAVDAHVGAFLFSITIKQFLKNKTVLLITHSLYHVSHTDRILIFQNGEISYQGKYGDFKKSKMFSKIEASTIKQTEQYEHILNRKIDLKQVTQIQLIQDHLDRQIGAWQSFKIYLKRNSGLPFIILVVMYVLIISGVSSYSHINLNYWALSQVAKQNIYFYIQIAINFGLIGFTILLGLNLYLSKMYQNLHDDMIKSILFSPISFFQKVSADKIITRLSNDLNISDQVITSEFNYSLIHIRLLVLTLFSIYYIFFQTNSYYYIGFFTAILVVSCYYFRLFYGFRNKIQNLQKDLVCQLNGMYSEMVDGLPTIRAFKKVKSVFNNFQSKMSTLSSASIIRTIIDAKILLNILVLTNVLAILKVMSLLFLEEPFQQYSIFLIFNIFSLEDAAVKTNQNIIDFTPVLQSLGKCQDLTGLQPQAGYSYYLKNNWVEDSEFKQINHSKEIFNNGEVIFQDYSFKYRPQQQSVLKNISLVIKSGQKIGIVGRTGSGKSTLMLGLLRIIQGSSGKILIDGQDTSKLSLEQLRSNINIILQDHFMYNGTIRENVDPSGCQSDAKIVEALKMCGIWQNFQQKEGLETIISEGGDNLSSGQKQLINIARSLINPKKIVLIDEATASIDIKTDELIQRVMKKVFADRTVLTIAHRINTVIDSDRILVLERGRVAELDKPLNLLKSPNSVFTKLYNQSGKSKEN